jgi:3-oxoacyl-[acyl-carrier protein] reductase
MMSDQELILITGASGGVGSSTVEFLLAAGWRNLVCHYRKNVDTIKQLLAKYDLDPCQRLIGADLTEENQVESLQRTIQERFGPVYGLVNLVGASNNCISWRISKQDFKDIIDANVITTFLACRQFAPDMRSQGRGRIINISSIVGYTGVAGAAHYCAAKAAVIGFSKALALELAPKNVVVSIIALGYFQYGLINSMRPEQQETIKRMIPAQKFGHAQHLAGLLSFLLSDAGAYSGGQVYHLNGGLYS